MTQTLPAQHPEGQVVASQTHAPPVHRWPELHAGPAPQVQAPPVQAFDRLASQATHAAPPTPQVADAEV